MTETTQIVTRPEGRPTKKDESTVAKLIEIFKIGGNVEEASSTAGINKTTYYRWLEDDPSFATEMESAQHYADIKAKNLVVKTIVEDENDTNAKWWLEKREFKNNPTTQVAIQGGDMNIEFVS